MKILSVLFCFLTMSFNFSSIDDYVLVIQDGKTVAIDIGGDHNTIWDCTGPEGPCQAIPIN